MKKVGLFQAFVKMLPKIIYVSPFVFVLWQLTAVMQGILYGILAPVTQLFFDKATDFAGNKVDIYVVFKALLILGGVQIARQIINGIVQFIMTMYYKKAEGDLSIELHKKLSKISPVSFEDTKVLDEMNKAVEGKNEAIRFTGSILTTINFYIPFFVIMSVYLYKVKPLLIVSLVLTFVPVLLTQILKIKIFAKAEDKSAPIRREFEYYEKCIAGRENFKETRMLGTFWYFKKLYSDTLVLLNKIRFKATVKSNLAQFGMQMLSLSGVVAILLILFDSLIKGDISPSAFVAVYAAVDRLFSLMKEWIYDSLDTVTRNFGRVQYYLGFLQMPDRGGEEVQIPDDVSITLRNVSFKYPAAENKAIDNVTLHINPGEIVALVGENGSGKSTLIRLITGLYTPDEGVVLHGETSTQDVTQISLFKRISAVFQKYQRYQMTFRENIGISNTDAQIDDYALDSVCHHAGVDVGNYNLPEGYDTMLSREFDGVDLSGGQWQRIAIARGLFRNHSCIILDEPTAAIDPIEETRIYNDFAQISRNKIAIIVTHRLGSVKLADRIIVMKKGCLVEQGTHEELMSLQGEYTSLYKSQEQWYKNADEFYNENVKCSYYGS